MRRTFNCVCARDDPSITQEKKTRIAVKTAAVIGAKVVKKFKGNS